MIKIENVHMHYIKPKKYVDHLLKPFHFEKFEALKDVNINICLGDNLALLGPNGAGKTTLLKLIGGLLLPSKGSITINGYQTLMNNLKARMNVGFVLNEERSFYWRLSGKQNLEFFGSLENLSRKKLNMRIDELLQIVGLKKYEDTLVASYSSGMKQRLAIARGLLNDPSILILDEPTRTLDPISSEEIIELIKTRICASKERILLIATHRLEEVEKLCNRVCIIKNGRIIMNMSKTEINSEGLTLFNCYKKAIDIHE